MIWDNRRAYFPELPEIDQAVRMCEGMEKPMVLVDLGDSVPSGSTGDSTSVLHALLKATPSASSCVVIKDPDTVQKAQLVGEGNFGRFMIGGSDQESFNRRLAVDAKVVTINPEPFVCLGPLFTGTTVYPGVRALLLAGNIHIIVCEHACTSADQNMLITMGIDPKRIDINVQKASNSFKDTYKGVFRSFLYAQTPGYSDPNQSRLPFKHVTRPIYPFDDM